jgi:ABC-type transport system involved in multi-copper enzyme maturation permease subunit
MNPVLAREVRERFRTRRAPWFIFAWTLGMGLVGYVTYLLAQTVAGSAFGLGRLLSTGYMGRFMFQSMSLLLVSAVVMVVPGLTALAIVGERERQTFQLLQVTQLTAVQLVIGKLWSSLSYFLLLLVAVLPVASLPLLFGGMGLGDVLGALGMLFLIAVMIGSVSILISARARSSRGAVAGSYLYAFLVSFFTLALLAGELLIFRSSNGEIFGPRGREVYSVWVNPYFAMVDAVDAPLSFRSDPFFTPYTPFEVLLLNRQGVRSNVFQPGVPVGFEGAVDLIPTTTGDSAQEVRLRRGSIWVRASILYVVISFLSLIRAAALVRAPARRILRVKQVRHASA